jgi:hypothetical protein
MPIATSTPQVRINGQLLTTISFTNMLAMVQLPRTEPSVQRPGYR